MRWIVSLAVGVALLGAPAAAQQRPTGWIGISLQFSTDQRGRTTDVLITDVSEGSPAEAAGVMAGDRLLAVNDLESPSQLRNLAQRLRLRPGDRVRLVITREGRRREIRLRATEAPSDFDPGPRVELSFEPDSMVEWMVRGMDAFRLRIIETRAQNVQVRSAPPLAPSAGLRIETTRSARTTAPPSVGFFLFRGAEHDSLRLEMGELDRIRADLQVQLTSRGQELRLTLGRVSQVRLREDVEFRRLQEEMEETSRRSAGLEAAMAIAARTTAGFEYSQYSQYSRAAPRSDREAIRSGSRTVVEYRPLTPYLLGRNRVAGAEVLDLRPEMARYFGVETGVLIVDVAARTPAAIAGIVPGDVIVRIDQVAVHSVDELRFGISQAGETLPLTLIRQGNSIQVLLRR